MYRHTPEGRYKTSDGKAERPLGRLESSWEDNIKMDCRDIPCVNMNYIQLAKIIIKFVFHVNTTL
jgi:hypothetical protein